MITARETIYAALFALISEAAPFVTASRRPKLINELSPSALPAIYMQQMKETLLTARPHPARYMLKVDFAIYAQNPDANASAAPQLNSLIDAVEAAMSGPPGKPQTLGDIVSHAYISGEIEYFEGALGNRAGAVIPIEIVTT